jgi:hypothetical protein
MSLKRILLPAVMIALIALLAPRANAQTMGEYAGVTAGAASGSGSIGGSFSLPVPSISNDTSGASSGTWGVSGTGASFEERAGAASGSGLGADFESRAGASSSRFGAESRWPGTGFSNEQGSRLDDGKDRFPSEDRFAAGDRFGSENRWPGTSFSDHTGLDTNYNQSSGY